MLEAGQVIARPSGTEPKCKVYFEVVEGMGAPPIERLRAMVEGSVREAMKGAKREVVERRKMGHVTALGSDVDEALGRARRAVAALRWEGEER